MLESEKKLVAQRSTRTRYDAAFKLACVEKVIQNPDRTFQSLASEIGIPLNNLYSWYNKYKKEKLNLTSEKPPELLTEEQLFFVQETIGAKEKDKIRYCRQHGIAFEKLREWTELYKDDRYQKASLEVEKVQEKNELVIDKMAKEIKELKQQLRKAEKEKQSALALLDLKKKWTSSVWT